MDWDTNQTLLERVHSISLLKQDNQERKKGGGELLRSEAHTFTLPTLLQFPWLAFRVMSVAKLHPTPPAGDTDQVNCCDPSKLSIKSYENYWVKEKY